MSDNLILHAGGWSATEDEIDRALMPDRAQALANELTDQDRAAGRPAPAHGYSKERLDEASAIVRAAGMYPQSVTRYRGHVIRSDKSDKNTFVTGWAVAFASILLEFTYTEGTP